MGAGLWRLFIGGRNSGKPAPTKFTAITAFVPIRVYQRLGAVSKKTRLHIEEFSHLGRRRDLESLVWYGTDQLLDKILWASVLLEESSYTRIC